MKARYVKLRPAHQSLIVDTLNSSLLEVLKITQNVGIMSNEIDNLFRCKKVYKFPDGEKVFIPKTVTTGHNLYSFIAHVLTDVDLNEPVQRKTLEAVFKTAVLLQKALLLGFTADNLSLLKQVEQVISLHKELLHKKAKVA